MSVIVEKRNHSDQSDEETRPDQQQQKERQPQIQRQLETLKFSGQKPTYNCQELTDCKSKGTLRMKPEVINISLSALGSRFVPIVPSVRLGSERGHAWPQ